ncbi:hypothetical protein, partial [Nonomuraea rubra]|uniref:hypothetical protein n=1 Tax=Nonomuraea rubra TaxID=46180 RepID=UPI003CD059F9
MTATTVTITRPGGSRFRPILALLGPHRPLLLVAIASGIAHHLVVLASAGVGAWVVSRAITGATPDDLRGGLIALGLLLPFLALTPWLESYLAHVAAFRVLADVRGRVYAAFERLAPGYLLQRRSGDLGTAAISDVEQLELWFAHTLSPLISAVTVPVAALTAPGRLPPRPRRGPRPCPDPARPPARLAAQARRRPGRQAPRRTRRAQRRSRRHPPRAARAAHLRCRRPPARPPGRTR